MTKRIQLERVAYVPGMGTFGRLEIPGAGFSCWTVEQDWESNKPRVSCIPEGIYQIRLGRYNRGGYPAYELLNVPGRSLIKIHRGNTMDDLLGCIAPGTGLGFVEGKWAVTRSREAFERFMDAMSGDDRATLRITSVFHAGIVGIEPQGDDHGSF